jgi:hypothetical protein
MEEGRQFKAASAERPYQPGGPLAFPFRLIPKDHGQTIHSSNSHCAPVARSRHKV